MRFREEQIRLLVNSGWTTCASVRDGVTGAGLPMPTNEYLRTTFDADLWNQAAEAVDALREHYWRARFAEECVWGVLLVPDPARLDTRTGVDPGIRRDQLGTPAPDIVDGRLPEGAVTIPRGEDWSLVATVTGTAGISLGSYNSVRGAADEAHTVLGTDTRAAMTRQIWGARVLQCGAVLPDCEQRETWTFTVFPGEDLVDGQAVSGTVLHGKVRFRLGKPDRGIGSARVRPGIPIGNSDGQPMR